MEIWLVRIKAQFCSCESLIASWESLVTSHENLINACENLNHSCERNSNYFMWNSIYFICKFIWFMRKSNHSVRQSKKIYFVLWFIFPKKMSKQLIVEKNWTNLIRLGTPYTSEEKGSTFILILMMWSFLEILVWR